MSALLPVIQWQRARIAEGLQAKQTVLVTNMGACDPRGAADRTVSVAEKLGVELSVAAMWERQPASTTEGHGATYLGADAIVEALNCLGPDGAPPDVVITGRVADSSLFLAPMIRALGWQIEGDYERLASGVCVSHLLECGTHLTGGYFYHPAGKHDGDGDGDGDGDEDFFADLSLPYAEITEDGTARLCKRPGSSGELSLRTCKEQLAYEIGDPSSYATPDIVANFANVHFEQVDDGSVAVHGAQGAPRPGQLLKLASAEADGHWKGFGEISYCGRGCLERAHIAVRMVRRWLQARLTPEEVEQNVLHYFLGRNACSLQPADDVGPTGPAAFPEVRLRFDGRFKSQRDARLLTDSVMALYTSGPAGGGGITIGSFRETPLHRHFVPRAEVAWSTALLHTRHEGLAALCMPEPPPLSTSPRAPRALTQSGSAEAKKGRVQLYDIAHARAGDKGDLLNVSLIPYDDALYLHLVDKINEEFVRAAFAPLVATTTKITVYPMPGIRALNVVIDGAILDGGVTTSRRIDRHGKSLSDLLLWQYINID